MALNAPYTPNTTIQSTQVSNDLLGLANGTNDTTANSLTTFRTSSMFDHVASGCVWSGDSYGVNRNASMTAGVIVVSGAYIALASVSARSFTASKDTYVDVSSTGTVTYTEVANNASSPALSANNIRIAIIITGATTIANVGSINQGQEDIVLPIASSIAYSVTDSLGNLICSRDAVRRTLGYRQIISNFTVGSGSGTTQITGLSAAVIVPSGRKAVMTVFGRDYSNNATGAGTIGIWDGTPGVGTNLSNAVIDTTTGHIYGQVWARKTLSAGAHTINASLTAGANNVTVEVASTYPAYLSVDLM